MYFFQETTDKKESKRAKKEDKEEGKYDMLRILQETDSYMGLGRHYQILWACEEHAEGGDLISNPRTWVAAQLVDSSAVQEWHWWKANKARYQHLEREPSYKVKTAAKWIRHTISSNLSRLFDTVANGRW